MGNAAVYEGSDSVHFLSLSREMIWNCITNLGTDVACARSLFVLVFQNEAETGFFAVPTDGS